MKIKYQSDGIMKPPVRCSALGRNGTMFAAGVNISVGLGDRAEIIRLAPVRSNGDIGVCYIDIPRKREIVEAIKDRLDQLMKPD